ncbi:MAG: MopE-related protein, partial [Myxococcota bacterium]
GDDCDDLTVSSYPGASDRPYDGVDADCAGDDDYDADADGYRSDSYGGDDCNDVDATVNPSAADTWYDGIDQNCDGANDYDRDGDGYVSSSYGGSDCNDLVSSISPAASDTWYDGVDSDCDGADDYDQDGDGYTSDAYGGTDCDDTNAVVRPGGVDVWYDGLDSNCDGLSDYDQDRDGYDSDSYGGDDCDDMDASVSPGDAEVWYDGVDTDCDGGSDYDQDGDGYDSDAYGGEDCEDTVASAYPGAPGEVYYDGVDTDCDGLNDYDQDLDGFESDAYGGTDCDDTDERVHPYRWESTTNGVDDDCDGGADTADTSTVTYLATGDDVVRTATFTGGFTFPFCGSNRSSANVTSNGWVQFGASSTSYTESVVTFGLYAGVAPLWDDLYPTGSTWAWIQYSDAVGFYWNAVAEFGAGGSNTLSVVLHESGSVYLEYGGLTAVDGLAGFSCGRGTEAEVDLTSEWANRLSGQTGIGTGEEDMVHELFGVDNDLDNAQFWMCANPGVDADGDGWSENCEEDDSNASDYPR